MSANFDVFNGDADGICALHQLRLTYPVSGTLITGAKRDIKLLEKVEARASDVVNVFDISMGQNKDALLYLRRRHETKFKARLGRNVLIC